ncbi:hypothetical protein DV738_g385, partial [Chaetothyriales sp. CBS 135597]
MVSKQGKQSANGCLDEPSNYFYSHGVVKASGHTSVVYSSGSWGGPVSAAIPGHDIRREEDGSKKETVIENRVRVEPHAQIHYSATVLEGAIIESQATVLPGAVVGRHAKICAGVTIREGMKVPDGAVVWGNGEQMRRRRARDGDQAEERRLQALDKEREVTMLILRTAAIKASQARRERGR